MLLTKLEHALLTNLLLLVCAITGVVGWHVPGWCKAATLTLRHVDEFAGQGRNAMHEFYGASINSKQVSGETLLRVQELKGTIGQLNTSVGNVGTLAGSLAALADTTKATVQDAQPVLTSAGRLLDSTTSVMDGLDGQVKLTAPMAGPLLLAWTNTGNDLHARLSDPALIGTMADTRKFMGSLSLMGDDTARKLHAFYYPEGRRRSKLGLFYHGVMAARQLAQPPVEFRYYLMGAR